MFRLMILFLVLVCSSAQAQLQNTLPPLEGDRAPQNFQEMWSGFDPRAEPLETEVLKEWEEDDVVLRVVRFRIGVFKNQKAILAAIYGVPKSVIKSKEKLPGLVQIHGGGQYADHKACLTNAKRGYATVSIAWAGRISSPQYRLGPNEVKLFWDGKTDDPHYRKTTDWGAVDAYHAPSRHKETVFPSAKPTLWTIDDIESPRNSPWFLCAIAARRALTFLEAQPEVDSDRLGVYGHSMGGKLTVMASIDERVKAAAPSCGGITDRENNSELFRKTISDDVSLREISCPIIFLSPVNDFHGRIGDLPRAINEIQSQQWRVSCSPHGNHQDLPEFEVAAMLWFDQHLKGQFDYPKTPQAKLQLKTENGLPTLTVNPDSSHKILAVDIYYTQHGKDPERNSDMDNTIARYWRHAKFSPGEETWKAPLQLTTLEKPLWVYANVTYALDQPVSGAGYYYRVYETKQFNVSSVLEKISPEQLKSAGVRAALKPTHEIEIFQPGWEKEWFRYRPDHWTISTHKIYDSQYHAPETARLSLEVRSPEPNTLVVRIDNHAAEIEIKQSNTWQSIQLDLDDFLDAAEVPMTSWRGIRELKLTDTEHIRPARGKQGKLRRVGHRWKGSPPEFRNLRWIIESEKN